MKRTLEDVERDFLVMQEHWNEAIRAMYCIMSQAPQRARESFVRALAQFHERGAANAWRELYPESDRKSAIR